MPKTDVDALDYARDGLNGYTLGVIGEAEYALGICPTIIPGVAGGEVFRRPASHSGTYGGWRWECGASHPAKFQDVPLMAELARRLAPHLSL